ncbi:hypothetical protein DL93DRAFT_123561 [Clavulina sp. PMI_390]|nr:hypothetical protein DL93DRAFT_123561 [Clavulina sp. PMI_390]
MRSAQAITPNTQGSQGVMKTSQNNPKPLPSLPAEILGEIFQLTTACERINDTPAGDRIIRTLVAITSVNSYWRTVAISRKSLWTIIHISDPKSAMAITSALKILELFIERPSTASLDIYLALACGSNDHSHILWRSLSSHLYRCRKLVINRLLSAFARLVLPLRQPLERLESFHLDAPFRESYSRLEGVQEEPDMTLTQLETIFPVLSEAPNLQELRLIGHAPFWRFEWRAIESHLRGFPHLRVAILRFSVSDDEHDESSPQPFAIASLHTLASANWDHGKHLLLPDLRHFISITGGNSDLRDIPTQFSSLERLSLTRTQTYRLGGVMPITPMLSLIQLDLVCSAPVDELLVYLSADTKRGQTAIFPSLQRLQFYDCRMFESRLSECLEATFSLLEARPTLHIVWDHYPAKWELTEAPESCRGRLFETSDRFPQGWMI